MISVADILAEGGPIAGVLGTNFEARPEQTAMAGAVAEAMAAKSHLLVEAGTGVGKSFAYLIPAMLRCAMGERVVVATNTIALQEQLVLKDVPFLVGVMEEAVRRLSAADADVSAWKPIKPVLVKGRGNYVSIRRLKLASERQERLLPDPAARRSLHVIQEWAYETVDGSLSTLPALERPGVWDKVQSDSGNCMGKKCPHYQSCFYQKARAEMDGANLLICNHALFFSDLALRSQEVGFLPSYDHVVLDEAHNIEDVASEHFGVTLAEGRVQHLLSTLYHQRSGKGYLPHITLMTGDSDAVERAIGGVRDAGDAARDFFESVSAIGRPEAPTSVFANPAEARTVRVHAPGAVVNVLTPAMRELALRLKTLKDLAKNEADRFELNAYALRAELIAADAETLVSQSVENCAYWAEVSGGEDSDGPGRVRRVTLACAPVEIAPLLKERLFAQPYSVILTSATLATRTVKASETREGSETAFAHAMSRLGCEGARALQLGSPFEYTRQVRFYIDRGVPDAPKGGSGGGSGWAAASNARASKAQYHRVLAERIMDHVKATEGGAFVLFTSFASLNAVASELAGPLARLGYPLLAQGRDGSRQFILERFKENEQSVLLGAASFWQGVDVRGRGLRNVIITRLPFDPPDRPLNEARLERIQARGGDPFNEDSLPRAVIRFKQGFGRLIRSKTDQGRVVVMDPRVVTARYGRRFLSALPKGVPMIIIDANGHEEPHEPNW